MQLIADLFLAAGACGAAVYCFVLSRRLRKFTDLEDGIGGAVAVLSVQVDDLVRALNRAQLSAESSVGSVAASTRSAEAAVQRLEILIASLHDIPDPAAAGRISPFYQKSKENAA